MNFNTEVDGRPLSALAISGDADNALKLTFEFETVWGLKRLGYAVPIWMSQGTGGILSTIEVRTGRVTVGAETNGTSSHSPSAGFSKSVKPPSFIVIRTSSATTFCRRVN